MSVLLAVVFVGISSVLAISALVEGKAKSPRLLPRLEDRASFFDLFTAVPVIVTAFTFHFNGENSTNVLPDVLEKYIQLSATR